MNRCLYTSRKAGASGRTGVAVNWASHACHFAALASPTLTKRAGVASQMSGPIPGRLLIVGAVALVLGIASGCGGAQTRKAAHMEKGRAYLAAQNYPKARIEFQNALQIDPKDAKARYEVGFIDETNMSQRSPTIYQ